MACGSRFAQSVGTPERWQPRWKVPQAAGKGDGQRFIYTDKLDMEQEKGRE